MKIMMQFLHLYKKSATIRMNAIFNYKCMDFNNLKQSLLKVANQALDKGVEVLQTSGFHIKKLEELEAYIDTSKNYTSPSGKEYCKKSLLIVVDEKTDFYKKLLYAFPVLYTKAWSKNIQVKIISSTMEGLELAKYTVTTIPTLVVFGNRQVVKTFAGEENIFKIVNKLSLDIDKHIEEL